MFNSKLEAQAWARKNHIDIISIEDNRVHIFDKNMNSTVMPIHHEVMRINDLDFNIMAKSDNQVILEDPIGGYVLIDTDTFDLNKDFPPMDAVSSLSFEDLYQLL